MRGTLYTRKVRPRSELAHTGGRFSSGERRGLGVGEGGAEEGRVHKRGDVLHRTPNEADDRRHGNVSPHGDSMEQAVHGDVEQESLLLLAT